MYTIMHAYVLKNTHTMYLYADVYSHLQYLLLIVTAFPLSAYDSIGSRLYQLYHANTDFMANNEHK